MRSSDSSPVTSLGKSLVFGIFILTWNIVEAQQPPSFPLPPDLPTDVVDPNARDLIPKELVANFTNSVDRITAQIAEEYSFCIQDIEADKRSTFDFKEDSPYLQKCMADLGETFVGRVCSEAEIKLYFRNVANIKDAPPTTINCNEAIWPTACEAGWAGLPGSANGSELFVDPTVVSEIEPRTLDPQPCCEGFFCPQGLTCMLPCPRGAYCPSATNAGGFCWPYGYRLRPESNNICGGADLWLTFKQSKGIFCEAGAFCPTTTEKAFCEEGHYCKAGSTEQKKCSFLSSCPGDKRDSQNMKSSGILLLVILFILLLLIYNCSEHLLHIRQRRKSKARDVAAREALEHLTAVERWRRAKEAALKAKKQAVKFSSELTRQLSKKKSNLKGNRSGPLPGLHKDAKHEARPSGDQSGPLPLSVSGPIEEEKEMVEQESYLLADSSSSQENHRVTWSNDVSYENPEHSHNMHTPVQALPTDEEIPSAMSEFEVHVDVLPAKLPRTRSQVYKYAYGQIEKEKATQQMKYAGVNEIIQSDGFREMIEEKGGRFRIELSFIGLCLILKGSGKKILNHVTGKFSPCRVSAVMGPSGAGKTTFLNALAGKETSSTITGQVYINGQIGSIQSYKRIIGFVPQDDTVHGSLTVEENLLFSAKYRLPVGLPIRERVLIVERIINTLGLDHVRDSLVGTVETRGISGGQRKRVNVGMELVFEPSLLILDEPTSGLDSTSSRLVLQALRREACMGVNVCVVLHQPSYGLFRMFDDVMLLAKGGFTVYLGPVDDIEAYFQSLGFEVPDRLNPPDYFMDVLEGAATKEADPSFDVATLPLLWMSHKGYRIPPDLLDSSPSASKKRRRLDDPMRTSLKKTYFQDVWEDLRVYMVVYLDAIQSTFTRVPDLSGRRTPGFVNQFRLILGRVTKQRFREARVLMQDYIILLLAGICMGVMADWTDSNLGAQGYTYTIIAVSLLVMIASLRTFTLDKLNFWRESASGINKLAYFFAKDTVDHFNTIIKPLVYLSMFYFYNDPRSTFTSNYVITLALVYCVTGVAYILAIVMNPAPAQLFSVFIPVVATLIVTDRKGPGVQLANISFAEWALEGYVIANAEQYTGVWLITRCGAMADRGYRIGDKWLSIGVLIVYGVGARIVAFFCLVFCNRKRQK